MAYATVDDLKARFGPEIDDLLDRDGDGQPDPGVADAVIEDAGAEIETLVGVRYVVPVIGSAWLKSVCCDLARYRLHDDVIPEAVKERYDNAIARLKRVAAGEADLLTADGSVIPDRQASAARGAVHTPPRRTRIFSDRSLAGFVGE